VHSGVVGRTFLINGNKGDPMNKRAPTLELEDLVMLAAYLEKKALCRARGIRIGF
jgi:hypothetical protein